VDCWKKAEKPFLTPTQAAHMQTFAMARKPPCRIMIMGRVGDGLLVQSGQHVVLVQGLEVGRVNVQSTGAQRRPGVRRYQFLVELRRD
jgi:hypothetical protein